MIKINLLPYREKEKKENLQRQIFILSGTLVLFLLIMIAVQLYFSMSISGMETKIREADAKLVVLNKKVGDLEGFKRDKREIEQKLGVIKSLEGNRLFPVRMLDEINRLVPAGDIWLEKISENGQELRIEGIARDSITVAGFMKSLEKAGFIQSVDLGVSREKEVSGVKLQQFILNCGIKRGM
ncbi:MAG: PilN domain-containing protein [Deltaproteobacteria bacterium]|jgi:type IV pilus assembly protein PilN|nr:PilN domain-containing protein [Deltaproteobacteria bacterium]